MLTETIMSKLIRIALPVIAGFALGLPAATAQAPAAPAIETLAAEHVRDSTLHRYIEGKSTRETVDELLEALESNPAFAPGTSGRAWALRGLASARPAQQQISDGRQVSVLLRAAVDPQESPSVRSAVIRAFLAIDSMYDRSVDDVLLGLLSDSSVGVVSAALASAAFRGGGDERWLPTLRQLMQTREIEDPLADRFAGFGMDLLSPLRRKAAELYGLSASPRQTLDLTRKSPPEDASIYGFALTRPLTADAGPFWESDLVVQTQWLDELGAMAASPAGQFVAENAAIPLLALVAGRAPALLPRCTALAADAAAAHRGSDKLQQWAEVFAGWATEDEDAER